MEKKDLSIVIAIILAASLAIIFVLGVVFGWWQPKRGEQETGIEAPAASQTQTQEKARQELDILTAATAKEDQPIAGVTISKQDGKKIIKNTAEGYAIETPLTMVSARSIESSVIKLYEPDEEGSICLDPQCPSLISIRARENQAELSLDEWAQKEEARVGYPMFQNKEVLTINGQKAFRIEEETLRTPATYYYFLTRGEKTYQISIGKALEPQYRKYLETFQFE